jgi:hypothetical protein
VWLQVLAADWSRLAEEFPFVGRTGLRGDDAGSRVIAARLCGTLMHLGFVLERRWPPYSKWLGTAFAALPRAGAVTDELQAALRADSWPERQDRLAGAARLLHDRQRSINLPGVDEPVVPFHDRPFLTVRPDLGDIVRAAITDPAVRALPGRIGAIEQWVDNVAVLASPPRRRAAVRAVLGGVDLDEG